MGRSSHPCKGIKQLNVIPFCDSSSNWLFKKNVCKIVSRKLAFWFILKVRNKLYYYARALKNEGYLWWPLAQWVRVPVQLPAGVF